MRNTDYVIRITTSRGRSWRYLKEDGGWTQTAPTGIVRRMTAEQLLSHLLPPLAKDQPHLSVTVQPKTPSSMNSESRKPGKKPKALLHHGFLASKLILLL